MPRHISILFPQGQISGMLDNLPVELVEFYRELALKILDFDLVEIINKGPEEVLNKLLSHNLQFYLRLISIINIY